MLPVSGPVIGSVLSTATRLVRSEFDIDDETRQHLQRVRENLEETSEIVGNFSLDEPGSWARTAGRVMDRAFETRGGADFARDWRRERGFTSRLAVPAPFIQRLHADPSTDVARVFDDGEDRIDLLRTPSGMLFMDAYRDARWEREGGLFYHADLTDEQARRFLAEACWNATESLRLESDGSETSLRVASLAPYVYRGDRLELIDQWRAFLHEGVPRNVLLQGAPGTGKTTLCCHAAREIGSRTLLVDGSVLGQLGAEKWRRALQLLNPTVVVLDDIDRAGGDGRVGGADTLRIFAEARDAIPLLLMTSNDHTQLPEALRRPGRIDRIVEFDEPSSEIRRDIVCEIADEEAAELTEARTDWLVDLMEEYSAAHVREALRRASVLGWETVAPDEQTFRMHREHARSDDWLESAGFRTWHVDEPAVLGDLFERGDSEIVFRDDMTTLEQVELTDGVDVCRSAGEDRHFNNQAWFRVRGADKGRDANLRAELARGVSDLFWRGRDAVLVDERDRDLEFRDVELDDERYVGPRAGAIDRWRQFIQCDRPRCALLTGPPGTGKSTLARQAARELGDRALIVESNAFNALNETRWSELLELTRPDAVVVDDVDRIAFSSLEGKLQLLEGLGDATPLLLFTCNDESSLPEAMRRPGRIDETIEFDTPDPDQRRAVVDALAERVGVVIPPDRRDQLDRVFRHQSPAHAREMLRRAQVLGWNHLDTLPGDTTFENADEPDSVATDNPLPVGEPAP